MLTTRPPLRSADSVAAVNNEDALTDRELADMDARAHAATDGPWHSFVEGRNHDAGDDFIRTGGSDDGSPDMYVTLYYNAEPTPASAADLDFIASARQDVPRLVAEVRRLREASG